MKRGEVRAAVVLSAIAAALAAPAARADAIYGCWSNGSERVIIEVDGLTTPGGARPEAQFHRHGATYVAPAGERDAGRTIVFSQVHDELATREVVEASDGAPENWTPCKPQAETS